MPGVVSRQLVSVTTPDAGCPLGEKRIASGQLEPVAAPSTEAADLEETIFAFANAAACARLQFRTRGAR